MVFSSFEFLLWFLPFFLACYYLISPKYRNHTILFFSLVFYAYGCVANPLYFVLIILSLIFNWFTGIGIAHKKLKKPFLILGLVVNFGALFVFKYLDFVLTTSNKLFKTELPLTNLVLPIGISFYTFQIVSYLIDVYRGTVKCEKSIINLGTYIFAFPQLIAGPIVKYESISKQLHHRSVNKDYIIDGIEKFVLGLGLKVLLANRIGGIWREAGKIGYSDISAGMAWLAIISYSLQIYFDFYGYSLMAIGLGKLMGFDFPQNFNDPYMATSMTDFWRRWHMTLGTWFKEYVYIPLGGNRKGKKRQYINLFIVWFLTGVWHGAGANFILWGLFLAAIIIFEKAYLLEKLNKHKVLSHLYMVLLIPLSWLIFEIDNLKDIAIYLGRLVGIGGGEYVYAGDWLKNFKIYWVYLLIGLILCTPVGKKLYNKISKTPVMYVILAAIVGFAGYTLYMGLNDPFMYFRF